MEMEVVLFDLDFKLQLSTLLQCILSKYSCITDHEKRIPLYREAIDRVIVYQPNDIQHFSLILSSLLANQHNSIIIIIMLISFT